MFSNLGASLRTLAGGEVAGYTKLLTDSRNEARARMWSEARARGANAVIAMRFDCNEIGDISSRSMFNPPPGDIELRVEARQLRQQQALQREPPSFCPRSWMNRCSPDGWAMQR